MAWDDRLKDGAYTSPSGNRFTFLYEDVSRTFDKKTSSYDFPDATGTYVQDTGATGRKYPITAIFSGEDCDLSADAFEDALAETGRGRLEHPIYGTIDVVPFGTVTRSDALKSAANQSTVEVTFWETIPLIYPQQQNDPASEVLDAVRELTEASGLEVANSLDIFSSETVLSFKSRMTALVNSVKDVIGKAIEIKALVVAKVSNVIAKIDAIVVATLETAQQVRDSIVGVIESVVDLVSTPSVLIDSIKQKFNSYKGMIDSIIAPIFLDTGESDYLSSVSMTNALLGGLVVNIVESEFETQGSALETAEDLLELFETVTDWTETTSQQVGIVNTGESYTQLQKSVALTAGYLVEISFTLKKERAVILTRARSIVDLVAELYGSVDDVLDFFITSNNLSGSEIIEVPKGREVLYYV